MIREFIKVGCDPNGHKSGKMSGQRHIAPTAKGLTDFTAGWIIILSQVERHGRADCRTQHPLQHLSQVCFQQKYFTVKSQKATAFHILFISKCYLYNGVAFWCMINLLN